MVDSTASLFSVISVVAVVVWLPAHRADILLVYKILFGMVRVNSNEFFTLRSQLSTISALPQV